MEYILWALGVYMVIGFLSATYAIISLWSIGHFDLPRKMRLNPVVAFLRIMVLWGTIFFMKKAKPNV